MRAADAIKSTDVVEIVSDMSVCSLCPVLRPLSMTRRFPHP